MEARTKIALPAARRVLEQLRVMHAANPALIGEEAVGRAQRLVDELAGNLDYGIGYHYA